MRTGFYLSGADHDLRRRRRLDLGGAIALIAALAVTVLGVHSASFHSSYAQLWAEDCSAVLAANNWGLKKSTQEKIPG